LPKISLGLLYNFGSVDSFENGENIVKVAFDKGVTHFDLANNYGPVPSSAEKNFGKILKSSFKGNLRDEMVISTKVDYKMGEDPYGDPGGSKILIVEFGSEFEVYGCRLCRCLLFASF
jgi:L-glyceraldehyde 3-phosphate reductase